MNRALTYLNACGVVLLAGLCLNQWRVNRQANLEVIRLEHVRLQNEASLADLAKNLATNVADLERFRQELDRTQKARRTAEDRARAAQAEIETLHAERTELKARIDQWTEAVAARDARLQEAADKLRRLADERNAAITQHNELAEKYNGMVKDLNDRTQQLNELIEKVNKANRRP